MSSTAESQVKQKQVVKKTSRRTGSEIMHIMRLVESSHAFIQIHIVLHFTVAHGSIDHRSAIVGSLVVSNMSVEHSIINHPFCIIYSRPEESHGQHS